MYQAFGADRRMLGPLMSQETAACLRARQAELGRTLTLDEVRACMTNGSATGTGTWIAIGAGFVVLAGVGVYLYKKRHASS